MPGAAEQSVALMLHTNPQLIRHWPRSAELIGFRWVRAILVQLADPLLDHRVGDSGQRGRYLDAERLRGSGGTASRPLRELFARPDQAGNAQYPALDPRHRSLGRRKIGVQKRRETAVVIGAGKPGGNAEGVVLVGRAAFGRKPAAPHGRIDLGDGRMPSRNVPAVVRPEMQRRHRAAGG